MAINEYDYKVWVGLEQRLDGLTGRWGPDPYVNVVISEGSGDKLKRHEFSLSLDMAKLLARGLTKTAKRAVSQ